MIKNNRKGVTLIELILTLALLAILSQVVYSVFFVGADSFAVSSNKGFSQQGVRNTTMFLESEFKYANDLYSKQDVEEGITETIFYGLTQSGDYIVVSEYKYIPDTSAPAQYIVKEVRRFNSDWKEAQIRNTEMGLLSIFLNQVEVSGRRTSDFDLEYNIYLDDGSIITDLEWDLSNVEEIVYYSKTQDAISGSIILSDKVSEENENDGNENNETQTPALITLGVPTVRNSKNSTITISSDGSYSLGNNNPYSVIYSYSYTGNVDDLTINTGSLGYDHDKNEKIITISGTSPKNKDPNIEVSITISAPDAISVTNTVIIGS